MTDTEFKDPKSDFSSWIRWIDENLDRSKIFFREAGQAMSTLARQALSMTAAEARFLVSKLSAVDFICGSLGLMVVFVATLFLLSGLGLISYQVFLWLKDGVWSEFPIVLVFNFLFENTWLHQWFSNPESWIGLQKVVEWLVENVPLSLVLIVPALAAIGGTACLMATAMVVRFYQFKNTEKN